jgi:tetratricopeptide (TPR) repeat protein
MNRNVTKNESSNIHAGAPRDAPDSFADAKKRLFAPLRNRVLAGAADALSENRVVTAETLVATYLEKKPRDPDALNLMADIARRSKRFEDAERLLSQCLKISPDCAGYRYNYAVILRRLHKDAESLIQIESLLRSEPHNPLFRDQKATILTALGRHDDALALRRALSEQYPASAEVWLQYSHALRNVGIQDECIAAIRKAIELLPSLTAAYGSLADLKVYRFTNAEIERMEGLLREAAQGTDARKNLHHALGKAYSDTGNYAKSFENYAKANALRRLDVSFDQEKLSVHRRACEAYFTESFFRDRTGWGCTSRAPIFIVGMPRSGSTLLEQILSSHSEIEALGELADLDMTLVPPLAEVRDEVQLDQIANGFAVEKGALVSAYIRILDRFDAARFRSLGDVYLELTRRRRTTGRPFFTDKALRNFFYVGLIHLILPNAKIIDARRHPLDCGWSCFRSQFPGSHFAYRLSDIGQDYANYVRFMAHFDRALPGRVHRVIYEDLVAEPRREVQRLFEYVQLPFEEQCLRFYENKRAVFTQSSEQVRQPLYRSGVAQWRSYEAWLGPLKAALGPVLDSYPDPPK